jgi:RNA polymerase sigma factor (sigma-70 family)
MLRITKLEAESESRLLVEGRITRDTVNELARLSDGCFASSATLALDLSGVTFVDHSGVPLLKTLRARGATLEGCSGYVTELLDRASGKEASREAADPLVEGLRRGDEEAFAALVRREGARLLATARRLLGSTQDAEDAVQEAFLQAHRAIDRFNGDSRLSTWLHRIVVNAALMKLRSRRRKPEQALDELRRNSTRAAPGSRRSPGGTARATSFSRARRFARWYDARSSGCPTPTAKC